MAIVIGGGLPGPAGPSGETDPTTHITLTYEGSPQVPMSFTQKFKSAVVPVATAVGSNVYTGISGKTFEGFSYSEDGTTGGDFLESIIFEDIKFLFEQTSIAGCGGVESISFPVLKYIFGNGGQGQLTISGCPVLEEILLDEFDWVTGTTTNLQLTSLPALTSLALPALIGGNQANGNVIISGAAALASFVANNALRAQISIATAPLLTTVTLGSLQYGGVALTNTGMVNLSLPAFLGTDGSAYGYLQLEDNTDLETISANLFVGGFFEVSGGGSITSLSLPAFAGAGSGQGGVIITNEAALASISLPALLHSSGGNDSDSFRLTNLPALTSLSLPLFIDTRLANVSTFSLTDLTALEEIDLPNFELANGMEILGATALTDFSAPSLVHLGAYNQSPNHSFRIPNSPDLANVTFGAVGTTLQINGNVLITGAALTEASVDQILHTLASLDGTGGTTLWSGTVDLSGGTSSAPSVLGAADVLLLQGQGATVVTN